MDRSAGFQAREARRGLSLLAAGVLHVMREQGGHAGGIAFQGNRPVEEVHPYPPPAGEPRSGFILHQPPRPPISDTTIATRDQNTGFVPNFPAFKDSSIVSPRS